MRFPKLSRLLKTPYLLGFAQFFILKTPLFLLKIPYLFPENFIFPPDNSIFFPENSILIIVTI